MNEARTTVTVTGQAITVEGLTLHDPTLAAFVAEAPDADRAALAERALRIGLLAICNANATVNVDVLRAVFARLVTDLAAPRLLRSTRRTRCRALREAPPVSSRAKSLTPKTSVFAFQTGEAIRLTVPSGARHIGLLFSKMLLAVEKAREGF